eukprot:TRINITY_DN11295_c0_g1_i1.p1 TRINITY_DN11295_c0_g1~~TRINITY_DN11295_c0_g1_i1.p1  ORF type:complete len:190 (+),score=33.24 TRINITY_DN11295_c0_g1_i1:7-576(+)
MSLGRLTIPHTLFLLCDLQERLAPHIHAKDATVTVAQTMLNAAKIFGIKVVATEQYPRGLGPTLSDLDLDGVHVYEKTKFSMIVPEVEPHLDGVQSVVLFGVEAHICIQQTAFDLKERGIDVHVLVDGTSSQRNFDRLTAFERMRHAGIFLTTTESVLLELTGSAGSPEFKAISALLKEYKTTGVDPAL